MTITQQEPKTVESGNISGNVDDFDLDLQISTLSEGTEPVGRHTHWFTCGACPSITSWPSRCC